MVFALSPSAINKLLAVFFETKSFSYVILFHPFRLLLALFCKEETETQISDKYHIQGHTAGHQRRWDSNLGYVTDYCS